MRITLIRGYNGQPAGTVLDLAKPVASLLIQRGVAVAAEGKKELPKASEVKGVIRRNKT